MEDIELTDTQLDRVETLRAELGSKTDPYATVTPQDTIEYLLDIASEIDDPSPASTSLSAQLAKSTASQPFPRTALRDQLMTRRLSHNNPEQAEQMDLYTIAIEFDIEGRSSMQKAELIDAILDNAEQQYTNPFKSVDIEFPLASDSATDQVESAADDNAVPDSTVTDSDETSNGSNVDVDDFSDSRSGQLDSMLGLMDTHDDKWWSTDGDSRYKMELPDGSVESARTKDDVRALLFKNY